MTENGPDADDVERALGAINADSFRRIQRDALKVLSVPSASSGRGNKPRGTTQTHKLREALALINSCREHFVPPPQEVVDLLSEAIGEAPKEEFPAPVLTDDQQRLVEVIANSPSLTLLWQDDQLPIKLTARQVAKKIGVSHVAVMNWWRAPSFRRALIRHIADQMSKSIDSNQ